MKSKINKQLSLATFSLFGDSKKYKEQKEQLAKSKEQLLARFASVTENASHFETCLRHEGPQGMAPDCGPKAEDFYLSLKHYNEYSEGYGLQIKQQLNSNLNTVFLKFMSNRGKPEDIDEILPHMVINSIQSKMQDTLNKVERSTLLHQNKDMVKEANALRKEHAAVLSNVFGSLFQGCMQSNSYAAHTCEPFKKAQNFFSNI